MKLQSVAFFIEGVFFVFISIIIVVLFIVDHPNKEDLKHLYNMIALFGFICIFEICKQVFIIITNQKY